MGGKKPANINRSDGNPDFTKPAKTAEAPGNGNTSILSLSAARVSLNPGSDISGVPASDIKTTDLPDRSCSKTKGNRFSALCSW